MHQIILTGNLLNKKKALALHFSLNGINFCSTHLVKINHNEIVVAISLHFTTCITEFMWRGVFFTTW